MFPDEKIDDRLLSIQRRQSGGSVLANVLLTNRGAAEEYDAVRRDFRALGVNAPEQPPFAGIVMTKVPAEALRDIAAMPGVEWIGAPAEDAPIEELLDFKMQP